jgi:hypothetical protein
MLVKVNDTNGISVRVTKLDIDDFGSVIPLREIELKLPQDDQSVSETLRHSLYAIVFTKDDSEEDGSTIILARAMTTEELNEEKERTVRALHGKREDTK